MIPAERESDYILGMRAMAFLIAAGWYGYRTAATPAEFQAQVDPVIAEVKAGLAAGEGPHHG